VDKQQENQADDNILEPLLDMVQLVHRNCIDHRHFAMVILEDEHHVKVLEVKLDSLKVNKLHLIQRNHQWRLHTVNTSITK